MKNRSKKKIKYLCVKGTGIVVSAAIPVIAILKKLPLWRAEAGVTGTVGIGAVMAGIVVLITFKKTVFNYLKEKTGMNHTPPLLLWVGLRIGSLVLNSVADILSDMRAVFVAGVAGCAIGTVLNLIAENFLAGADSAVANYAEKGNEQV